MRRPLSRLCWFVAGALVVLAILELGLSLLPVSTGMRRSDDSARWPLQNTPPHSPYSYSITWAMLNAHRGVTNNYGQVAPFDYRKEGNPIIVVGDSFVESLMNDYSDTLQAQLGRMIGRTESVYGLGVSGMSASDYVALSRQARDEFKPSAAIYVVTDGDLSESLQRVQGTYFLVPRGGELVLEYLPARGHGDGLGSRLRQYVADLSIHRYLQVNLQFSLGKVLDGFKGTAGMPAPSGAPAIALAEQRAVADWFLSELPQTLGLPSRCVALLVDTDRYAIYRSELASPRKDSPAAREYLIRRARELGFGVSDLESVFRSRFTRDHVRFDHFPIDRHWNRAGHAVGAQEAYRLLFRGPAADRPACLTAGQGMPLGQDAAPATIKSSRGSP